MQTTAEALEGWEKYKNGWRLKVDDVEIILEPLLFDEQFYLAVYRKRHLVGPKVVLKPGYSKRK